MEEALILKADELGSFSMASVSTPTMTLAFPSCSHHHSPLQNQFPDGLADLQELPAFAIIGSVPALGVGRGRAGNEALDRRTQAGKLAWAWVRWKLSGGGGG